MPASSGTHLRLPPLTMTSTFGPPAFGVRASSETSLPDVGVNTPPVPEPQIHNDERFLSFWREHCPADNLDPIAFEGTVAGDPNGYTRNLFPDLDDVFSGW